MDTLKRIFTGLVVIFITFICLWIIFSFKWIAVSIATFIGLLFVLAILYVIGSLFMSEDD